ncbi:MAG: hypothetical protein Kow0099_16110 [Candidatus Abyssubacteria bacterium]
MSRKRSAGLKRLHLLFRACLASSLLFLFNLSFQGSAVAEEGDGDWTDHLPFDVSGRYHVDYWGRWNTGDSEDDQQLFQYLNLRLDNIVSDKVSLRFSGRLTAELDGNDAGDDFFADIYDTFDHSVNGRIYYLYLDVKDPLFRHSNLRLGRQYSYEAETVLFTGVKYEQTLDRLRYYLQGGLRGTHYTSPEDDDTLGGVGLDYRILRNTTVGYDYLRVVDDFLDDDYHSVDVFQRLGSLKAYAQLSILNDEADDLNLFGSYYHSPLDLNLTARYYALLTRRDRLTNEFSPLFDIGGFDPDDPRTLSAYFPFHLVNLTAYKGWWDTFATSCGFETRWMDDNDERNDFNREYDRVFFTIDVWNVLSEGLSTSFTVEYWDVDAGEDSIAFGLDAEKKLNDRLDIGAGAYFSRYRLRSTFNGMTFSEDIETPSLYCRLKCKLRENIDVVARYQIEDEDDLGTSHELRLGCSIEF